MAPDARRWRKTPWLGVVLSLSLVAACVLHRDGTQPAGSYELGGTVTGLDGMLTLLGAGSGITLTDNGTFVFPNRVQDGAAYEVLVIADPDTQQCTVENGSGVMAGANVSNVAIGCEPKLPFTISGEASGLTSAATLWNGHENLIVDQDGPFVFPTGLADEATYVVQVIIQPEGQWCDVAEGTGTIAGANVTNVLLTCRSDNSLLADLTVASGTLHPPFAPTTTIYSVDLGVWVQGLTLTPTTAHQAATVTVAGLSVESGDASDPVTLDLGSNVITITVAAESGATRSYTVFATRANNLTTNYLKASNTDASDLFGYGIALSGDTLAVSAPHEDSSTTGVGGMEDDNGAPDSGAVYIFTWVGEAWSQQAYIKASNTNASDSFGQSVALSGDTLVVGAHGEDSNANGVGGDESNNAAVDSGAIYIFDRMGTNWTQQAYVKASNTGGGDNFGYTVALAGDTMVVGAPYEDSSAIGVGGNQSDESAESSGAVYVFSRSGETWSQQAYVKPSNTGSGDHFGFAVDVAEDLLVAGAPNEDGNATGINGNAGDNSAVDSGAAFIFERTGESWSQQAYVKASNTDANDHFGISVAQTNHGLAVGADGEDSATAGVNGYELDNSLIDSGAAYVFTWADNIWSQNAYLKPSNPGANDYFGRFLDIEHNTLAVGGHGEDSGATGFGGNEYDDGTAQAGAVYLFSRTSGSWAQGAYVKAQNPNPNDYFGHGVALSNDTLLVGAPYEDSGATGVNGNPYDNSTNNSGAAFFIR